MKNFNLIYILVGLLSISSCIYITIEEGFHIHDPRILGEATESIVLEDSEPYDMELEIDQTLHYKGYSPVLDDTIRFTYYTFPFKNEGYFASIRHMNTKYFLPREMARGLANYSKAHYSLNKDNKGNGVTDSVNNCWAFVDSLTHITRKEYIENMDLVSVDTFNFSNSEFKVGDILIFANNQPKEGYQYEYKHVGVYVGNDLLLHKLGRNLVFIIGLQEFQASFRYGKIFYYRKQN